MSKVLIRLSDEDGEDGTLQLGIDFLRNGIRLDKPDTTDIVHQLGIHGFTEILKVIREMQEEKGNA